MSVLIGQLQSSLLTAMCLMVDRNVDLVVCGGWTSVCTKVSFLGCATGCSRQSTCRRRRMCVGCWEMWKSSLRWLRTLQTEFVDFENGGREGGLGRCPDSVSEPIFDVSMASCANRVRVFGHRVRCDLCMWRSVDHTTNPRFMVLASTIAFRKPYSCGFSEWEILHLRCNLQIVHAMVRASGHIKDDL